MALVQGRSKALWKKLSTSIKMSQLDEVQQRKFQQAQTASLEKAGGDVNLNDTSSGDADDAGHAMYSKDALALRYSLRKDRRIDDVVRRLWAFDADRDELGCLKREGYMAFYVSVAKYLDAAFDGTSALASVASEWDNDRKGQDTMGYALFFDSLFQLVDVWVDSLDVHDYIGFLEQIALNIFLPNSNHLRDVQDIIFINASATDRAKLEKLRAKKELARGKELERSARREPKSSSKGTATTKTALPTSTESMPQGHSVSDKVEITHKAAPKRNISPTKRGVPATTLRPAASPTKAGSYVPAQDEEVMRNPQAHSQELGFDGDDVSGSITQDEPPHAYGLASPLAHVATPSPAYSGDPNLVAQFLASEVSDGRSTQHGHSLHGLSSHHGTSAHAATNGHAVDPSAPFGASTFGGHANSAAASGHPDRGAATAATHGSTNAGSHVAPSGHKVVNGGTTSAHTTFATDARGDVFSSSAYAQGASSERTNASQHAGPDHHVTSARFGNDTHATSGASSSSGGSASTSKISATAAASATNASSSAHGDAGDDRLQLQMGDDRLQLQMGDSKRSNKAAPSGQRAKLQGYSSNQQYQAPPGSLAPAVRSHESLEDARPMARGLAGKPVDPSKTPVNSIHRPTTSLNSSVSIYEPQHECYDDGSHRRPLSTYVLAPQGLHLRPKTSPIKHGAEAEADRMSGLSVTLRHDATPLKLEWQLEKRESPDMEQLEFAVIGGRLAVSKHRWMSETHDPHDDRVIDVSHFDATDDAPLDEEASTPGRHMDDINELRHEFQRRQLQPIVTESPPRPRIVHHRDLMPLQTSLSRQTLQVPATERRQRLRNVSSLPVLPRRQRTPPSVPRSSPLVGLELSFTSARLGPNRIELLKKKQRVLNAHLQSAPLKDASWHAPDTSS